jgi:nucleotidyltransferase substrate binding protein (TIGR01987 family)
MDPKQLVVQTEQLKKASLLLKEMADKIDLTPIERDAAIQRFEYNFELSWKLMRSALKSKGIDVYSPAEAIKKAFQNKIIDDLDGWLLMLRKRNLSSHVYEDEIAEDVASARIEMSRLVGRLVVEVSNEQE